MNETIFYFFYNLAHQSTFLDKVIIFTAVYLPYLVVVFAGVFIVMHHEIHKAEEPFKVLMQKKKEIIVVFFSGVVAWILAYILKLLFALPRPFDALSGVKSLFPESGFTFPSGHATFYMALAVSIYLLHKKAGLPAQAGYVFIILALLIGIARIIGGVHFPFDILGGFALGTLVSIFAKKYIN